METSVYFRGEDVINPRGHGSTGNVTNRANQSADLYGLEQGGLELQLNAGSCSVRQKENG